MSDETAADLHGLANAVDRARDATAFGWVQETIDIRLMIDGMIRAQQEADRDIQKLVEAELAVSGVHATRINELADEVRWLSALAFLAVGFTLGGVFLAFGWWLTS